MKLSLALVLLLLPALPGRAHDITILPEEKPGQTQGDKPAPQLVQLDRALTQKQEAKANGLVRPEEYQDFLAKFRAALDATMARVPPTPENKGLHAQIIARLGAQERGQALAGLDQALEENPTSPPLLRAKGLILYEQKDYPAAAEFARQAWKNSNQTDTGALALLKMSEGRTSAVGSSPGATQGVLPQTQIAAAITTNDSNKPYKLAIKGTAIPSEVPALSGTGPTAPLYAGRPMYSAATGLWDRAADGLILRGSDWVASADTVGENGFSGVGKFTSKGAGKGMLMAGGLMDALPVAVDWTLDKDRRLLSGDLTAITDISRGAYSVGKTAVVGFARDTRVAANDWADLLTLRQPTTYQALKATARTEAILLNFIPVGFAARGGRVVVVETAEVVGVSAGRRALARSIALGGREITESALGRQAAEVGAYEALATLKSGGTSPLRFSQVTASPIFSTEGRFAGQAISDVAARIRAGSLTVADVPVRVIASGENALIIDTRSSLALMQAGIPQERWILSNLAGNAAEESAMAARLTKNRLTRAGTDVLRITGGEGNASTLIGGVK